MTTAEALFCEAPKFFFSGRVAESTAFAGCCARTVEGTRRSMRSPSVLKDRETAAAACLLKRLILSPPHGNEFGPCRSAPGLIAPKHHSGLYSENVPQGSIVASACS